MDKKADLAGKKFRQGYNCAQSVFSVTSEVSPDEEVELLKISAAFGGGICGMGKTCGAVTGALMSLGLKYGHAHYTDQSSKDTLQKKAEYFIEAFKKAHGTIECNDLLAPMANTTEPYKNCPGFVESAVRILNELK